MTPTLAGARLARFRQTVTDAPASYSVYSAFSFYGERRGGELPGTWIVAALEALGHERAAIRQTVYRMEASQELVSSVSGRAKLYRLTPASRAEAQAGLAKIVRDEEPEWDGEWTFVHLRADPDGRVERERLREVLHAEGFAPLAPGVYVHPRDRTARVLEAARGHGALELVEAFRARRVDGGDPRAFVTRCWNLDALGHQYETFIARYQPVARAARGLRGEAAFVLRFAVVFDFLEAAWRDPELIPSLLPTNWPGMRAQRLARGLYDSLMPAALAFGDQLVPGWPPAPWKQRGTIDLP